MIRNDDANDVEWDDLVSIVTFWDVSMFFFIPLTLRLPENTIKSFSHLDESLDGE